MPQSMNAVEAEVFGAPDCPEMAEKNGSAAAIECVTARK